MAAVYLAVQESLDRQVALKVLDQTFADDPAFSERFLNEGRIIASLNHSNIITIYDVGITDGLHYISMEYVDGGDLRARIAKGVEPATALALVATIGRCLEFAHRVGVVHRDVKPANILFRKDGVPLLTDFGIAKQLRTQSGLTMTGSVLGSPGYLAPEQAEGREVDGRADIYSLGIILYEMLVGKRPYEGDTDLSTIFKHLSEPIPELPPDLTRCQPLVNQMIAKKPDERFQDAAVMLEAVKKLRASGPLTSRPIVKAPPKRKAARNKGTRGHAGKRIGIGLAVPVLLAVAAVITNSLLPTPIPAIERATQQVVEFMPFLEKKAVQPKTVASRTARRPTAAARSPATVAGSTTQQQPTAAGPMGRQNGNLAAGTRPNMIRKPNSGQRQPEKDPLWHEIDKLLTLGDKALEGHRLTKPKQDSALYYYREVLTLDPRNKRARRGLRNVAERYVNLAKREYGKADYQKAEYYVGLGLKAQRSHPRLLMLRKDVETQLRIEGLLASADTALRQRRLRTPPNDNAFYYFEKVLELESGNERAKQGFRNIASRYASMAKTHMDNYEYKEAQRYITLGLEVQPDNDRLLALKQEAHFSKAPKHLMNNVKSFFRGWGEGE